MGHIGPTVPPETGRSPPARERRRRRVGTARLRIGRPRAPAIHTGCRRAPLFSGRRADGRAPVSRARRPVRRARTRHAGCPAARLPHPDGVAHRALATEPRARCRHPQPARGGRTRASPTWRSPKRVAPFGSYYAPDPSSQSVCSIGGNIAENSGGAHCLKYGFTVHHVLGVEAVLPDGELVTIGGDDARHAGARSARRVHRFGGHARRRHEGHAPAAAQAGSGADAARRRSTRSTRRAAPCPSIISHGIVPAAVEMMDRLTIKAAEAAVHPELPRLRGGADRRARRPAGRGGRTVRRGRTGVPDGGRGVGGDRARPGTARSDLERAQGGVRRDGTRLAELLRAGRRRAADEAARGARAASASSRIAPGCASATSSTRATATCIRSSATTSTIPGQAEHAEQVASEILHYCIEAGGSITGEHGVGADKKAYMSDMFAAVDLDTMQLVRCAFDPPTSATRARCSRRRASAAKCPVRTAQHPVEQARAGGAILMPPVPTFEPQDAADARPPMLAEAASERPGRCVPHGNGTKLLGPDGHRADGVLSTARLTTGLAHYAGDLVATAPAGSTLGT